MSLDLITEELISRQSAEAQAIIRLLLAQIAELRAEVAGLKEEIARLKKTSRNSSQPPSSQHPHARPAPNKPKSKKRRGGQSGHARHERQLMPTDRCDDVQTLKPSACRRCGRNLIGSDPDPLRHQVWELPEIKPHVTEYQRHRLTCADCGETTCASLPPGVPTGQPYTYTVKNETTYELCATFALPRESDLEVFWNHPAGEHCFTIDALDPP